MKGKKILILFACVFTAYVFMASPTNAQASEFQVPSVYPTIQAGIDAAAAASGGIVLVAPGTYSVASGEVFPIILTDGVELIGAGAAVCTLDATGFYTEVIRCPDATPTRIEGFTIVNGDGYLGGGIACYGFSSPIIVNNFIIGNNAMVGGGIVCYPDSFPSIINNIFMGNSALYGGAIYCNTASAPMIINNTIVGNSAVYGAGIYCYTNSSDATVANNIINQNTVTVTGAGIYCRFSSPFIDYNNVFDNIHASSLLPQNYYGCGPGPNDISVDPEFVDSGAGDYHLQSYSFCVDAGTNDFLWLVNFDFDGHLRPLDGDGDELAVVDIGVDEVIPPSVITISATPNVLWPPNHKMVPVTLSVSTSDNCDPEPVCQIVSVSSNELDNAQGDGNTAPDWEITGDLTVNLRAERSGKGTGRIYTITVRCTDEAGNTTEQQIVVTVPHDQGNKTQSNNTNKGKKPEKIKK